MNLYFVYIRLHGPKGAYQGQYTGRVLSSWADALCIWSKQAQGAYCYFDNDQAGYAAQDALKLQKIIQQRGNIC